jgi:hypothetical protein
VASLLGGAIVAYASFTVMFVTMGIIDLAAFIVAWRGDLRLEADRAN